MWSIALVVSLLAPAGLSPPSSCLLPPVAAPVVDPFRAPPCEWCPGNRGLQYGAAPGAVVRAAAAGVVSFAGVVAGTRYVVVDHSAGGLRATYGDVAASELAVGDVVVAGAVVGRVGERRAALRVAPRRDVRRSGAAARSTGRAAAPGADGRDAAAPGAAPAPRCAGAR